MSSIIPTNFATAIHKKHRIESSTTPVTVGCASAAKIVLTNKRKKSILPPSNGGRVVRSMFAAQERRTEKMDPIKKLPARESHESVFEIPIMPPTTTMPGMTSQIEAKSSTNIGGRVAFCMPLPKSVFLLMLTHNNKKKKNLEVFYVILKEGSLFFFLLSLLRVVHQVVQEKKRQSVIVFFVFLFQSHLRTNINKCQKKKAKKRKKKKKI